MRSGTRLALSGLLASVTTLACGGGGGGGALNPFLGTLTITSALPAGATTCAATHDVVFSAAGADVHQVSAAGGECLRFTNSDTAGHRPYSIPATGCPELNADHVLTQNEVFVTAPLAGPKSCTWQDLENPPAAGGGGGGGY